MTSNVTLSLSRSNTGITDSSGNETKGESTSRTSTSLSQTPRCTDKKPYHLRNVARIVQLTVKARDTKSTPRLWPSKSQIDSLTNENRLAMRRGTVAAVGRTHGGSRAITKPPRKSFGNVFKDVEKGKSSPLNLLNIMAIREEVKKRKLMKKLRLYIRLQMLLGRWWREHRLTEVSQTHPFYTQYQMINDNTENTPDSAVEFKASYFKANKQMKMSQEAVRILTLPPEERTKDEIYYAMIALRGIDSIADYPIRMQQALAHHGMFQSFGPKRIIVKQTHPPCYFYFILYGTVVVATLDPGEPYAKTRVALRRGENFGELAIAHRSARQSTVITMEYTEFLTIDCDTYENIFMAGGVKTINDPDHNKFMKSLFFLKEIPLEKINSNPKAMEFCYFRRNSVMVKNSNNSDWIYIVKSGSLKVYKKLKRCYPRVNRRTGNYHSRAHTDGYHSFMCQHSEFNRYAMYNNLDLPSPLSPESDSEDEYDLHLEKVTEEKENLLSLPLLQRVERLIRPRTASGVISTYGQSSVKRNLRSAKSDSSKARRITPAPPLLVINKPDEDEEKQLQREGPTLFDEQPILKDPIGNGKRTLIDDYENTDKDDRPYSVVRMADEPSDNRPRTGQSHGHRSSFVTQMMKKELTEADIDPEFVLVQILTKGQAFGIQQLFLEDQPELFLVSAGAECVMLNKKIYKDLVNTNMAQNIKQHLSPYPSDKVLQENLQTRVNWLQYRKVTITGLHEEYRRGSATTIRATKGRLAFGKT